MATCADCVHVDACHEFVKGLAAARGLKLGSVEEISAILQSDDCDHFKDRARFVELPCAEWIEDEDMYGEPIFRCSNCNERFVLEESTPLDNCYFYCPNCGAKMDEQDLRSVKAMDNRINIDKAVHRVMDFHLNSELLCGMNGTFIDGDFVAFYHEERLYSVKNRKTGIVFIVYANSYPDAIRRVKNV